MIAFFDTSVHIAVLRSDLDLGEALRAVDCAPVRLSPVVASELLRGARGRSLRPVAQLVRQLVAIEPPSWRQCWLDAGRLLPRLFADHESIGLARLQNDLLIALTARHTGAALLSRDGHFRTIRRHVPFHLRVI